MIQRCQAHLRWPKLDAAAPVNCKSLSLDGREQDKVVMAIRKQGSGTKKAAGRAMSRAEGQGPDLADLDRTFDALGRDGFCIELAKAAAELFPPGLVIRSFRPSCIGEGWHTVPRCLTGNVHACHPGPGKLCQRCFQNRRAGKPS